MQRKDPNRAVELLKVASAIELGQTHERHRICYAQSICVEKPISCCTTATQRQRSFRSSLTTTASVANFPWGALARLGLARAYALDAANDPAARDKARTAYQNFLTLWKDADPDIPIYKQAKAEYARLR